MQPGQPRRDCRRSITRRTLVTALVTATAFLLAGASAAPAEANNFRLTFDNAWSQYAGHPQVLAWERAKRLRYRFEIGGQQTRDVRVAAVHQPTGRVIRRWRHDEVEPGQRRNVHWKGYFDGKRAPAGRYFFRVVDIESGQRATRQESPGRRVFDLRFHLFPIHGPVGWGDGWGAGRGHMGQDLFTNCGRPVRAARAGWVTWKEFQPGGAGYYVIVRGLQNNRDYVYMHLKKRRPVQVGERIHTGQRLGFIGATGNAVGCHLHFELWRGRWFDGGSAMPAVTRQLRRWRSWSHN